MASSKRPSGADGAGPRLVVERREADEVGPHGPKRADDRRTGLCLSGRPEDTLSRGCIWQAFSRGDTVSDASIDERSMAGVVEALGQHGAVHAAYILGSAATNRLRPDSDVDVAILPSGRAGLTIEERLALTAELTKIFGRSVDLGVLSTANVVYAKEAVTKGKIVFDRDPRVTARFAMLTLSMYASLQESRREVLRAYAA